ncbi:ABC transporter ATP-binding protein [Stomatohabitans albus]|uniref:ABC transporter ATP-binding protein n=1 Tax=Stomatohabitans albus TaxID=3110766 RepID=UPI00300D4C22
MNTFLADRTFLLRFKRLLSARGLAYFDRGVRLATLNGVIRGLALLTILPALTTLIDGGTAWGLPFWGWIAAIAILTVLAAIVEYNLAIAGFRGALDLATNVHNTLGRQIAKIPLGWFTAESAGVFSRLVSKELLMLGETAAHFMLPLVQNAVVIVMLIVGSFIWNWLLGIAFVVSIPVLIGFMAFAQWCHGKGKEISEPTEEELAARLIEFATSQGTIRACGLGTDYPQLRQAVDDNQKAGTVNLWYSTAGLVSTGVLTQIIIVTLVVLATWLTLSGTFSPVEGIAYIGMSLRFYDLLIEVQMPLIGLEDRRPIFDLIDELFDAPTLPQVEHSEPSTTRGSITLKDVHFGYQQHEPVLNGVSLMVPPKSMTAIVGPSGCGKTTIARLISRFYDVDSGAIGVGGVDVRDQTTEDLMDQLSMVFQDVYLFDDTLESNIRVGREDASDEDVLWAARLAGVEEIVERLPDGYQTLVGEGGRSLSGGERQRVSVARALLKRAPIVLFDEATSALDAENEANIVASMEALRNDATLVVIAHKLDTIRAADQVIVMNANGTIAQVGTHDQLVQEPGPYQGFWERRSQASGWKLV